MSKTTRKTIRAVLQLKKYHIVRYGKKIWISSATGEGMETSLGKFEKAVAEFFNREF